MKRPSKPKVWSDADKHLLSKLARKGTSTREISLAIGRHIGSVKKIARELKLVLRKTTTK